MHNSLRNQTEIEELTQGKPSDFAGGAETNAGTGMPIKDTMLSMIMLFLACLALAALAHVIV